MAALSTRLKAAKGKEDTGKISFVPQPVLEAGLFTWISVWNYLFAILLFHWVHVTKPLSLDSLNIELFIKLAVAIVMFLIATAVDLVMLAIIVRIVRKIIC